MLLKPFAIHCNPMKIFEIKRKDLKGYETVCKEMMAFPFPWLKMTGFE